MSLEQFTQPTRLEKTNVVFHVYPHSAALALSILRFETTRLEKTKMVPIQTAMLHNAYFGIFIFLQPYRISS